MVRPSFRAFFNLQPALLLPPPNLFFVALQRPSPDAGNSTPTCAQSATPARDDISHRIPTRSSGLRATRSREEGVKFVEETLPLVLPSIPNSSAAKVTGTADLAAAIDRAWLFFESVPEPVDLKIKLFGTLDRLGSTKPVKQ